MTWFADLTPHGADDTLAVGWIEPEHPFPTGDVPEDALRRIDFLIEHARTQLTRGQHQCRLCTSDASPLDNGEIRVVGEDGKRYAAPAMIGHYIRAHDYCPPPEFQAAVRALPSVAPDAEGRCLSCGSDLVTKAVYDDLIRASDRAPVVVTHYDCPRCAVSYERVRLR